MTATYEDRNRGICRAIENGERCDRGVRNVRWMLCNMHYSRMYRHGDTTKLKEHGFRRGVHPTVEEQNKLRALRVAEKQAVAREKFSNRCMCGCTFFDHKINGVSQATNCLVSGCNCKKFEEVNADLYRELSTKISNLGFASHFNDEVVCLLCKETVNIGTWFDTYVLRRARLHRGRDCASLRNKNL